MNIQLINPYAKQKWIRAIKEIRRGGQNLQTQLHPRGQEDGSTADRSSGYRRQRMFGKRYSRRDWDSMWSHRTETGGGKKTQEAHGYVGGFSYSPSADGTADGHTPEPTEDEIAERIFDWWISGKAYDRWYADTYLQMTFDFKD